MPVEAGQPVTVRVLGPIGVARGEDPLPIGGRQQRAVLALLVARSGTVQSVGRIAAALWGDNVPPGHAQTIHTYVSHLRSILGRGALTTIGGGYRLDLPDDAIDAKVFERLVDEARVQRLGGDATAARHTLDEALRLWHGEVLEDLSDYPFVAEYAQPLAELRLVALEARIAARLAAGEHDLVVAELADHVARHPLREQLHGYRILALYRSGRQAEALRAYQQVRTVLKEELGVEPGPALRQLQAQVLAHDPALDLAPPESNGYGTESTRGHVSEAGLETGPGAREPGPAVLEEPAPAPARPSRRTLAALGVVIVVAAGTTAYGLVNWRSASLAALPANSVGSVAADGTLRDAVALGPDPTSVAFGAGSLWVVSRSEERVYRVDPRDHRVVQIIPVGGSPSAVTVTGRDVWVANEDDGSVSRINADANAVVDTIAVGSQPSAIASGPSGVWVTNRADNTVQRIDPASGQASAAIDVGGGPSALAVAPGAVYVANEQDRSVVRIDPATGQQAGAPIIVGAAPRALAVAGDALWVANSDDQSVVRVDRRTSREVARIAVGDGPGALAVVGDRVWVASEYDGTMSVIDPARDVVEHRYALGAAPRAMALVDSTVWVAAAALADPSHVGGTLRPVGPILPGAAVGIDPSSAYQQGYTFRALRLVYDGLVALRYTGGPDAFTLVPDLATSIPIPSNGGRTYAFTLRSGIRFSNGATVKASDIKRGIVRALSIDPGHVASSRIIGVKECIDSPKTCNLDHGVEVDDASGSVVFHLSEPNSDFLFQLTYFGHATVPGAPPVEVSTPLPGTGPYMISAYTKDKVFTLTRNPYFRQWSFAAQPAGYPDRIEFTQTAGAEESVHEVEAGRADVTTTTLDVDAAVSADYARRYPTRFSVLTRPAVDFFLLNTTTPPFDDLRVRQALNYAVDRRTLATLAGGRNRVEGTCQMLPPNFPGYRRYCPYSLAPEEGPYAGADLPRARALVAASGKAGTAVAITGYSDWGPRSITTYVADVLRRLGFRVTITKDWENSGAFVELLSHPERPWQIVRFPGWIADWPAASNFYFTLFGCHQVLGFHAAKAYCNRALDALAARAKVLEATDPTQARQLWAEVDRRITDDAPAVFLYGARQSVFVSARVGNLQTSAPFGPLLSQLWVR